MSPLGTCAAALLAAIACACAVGPSGPAGASGAPAASVAVGSAGAPSARSATGTLRARPALDVADRALAARAVATARAEVRICVHVDPATSVDPSVALAQLQGSVDALVAQGYAALASPAALCPQGPHFLRTDSVHPKNSGNGPVAAAPRVTTPSPFMLFVALTTAARITTIFDGLEIRRGTEEIACAGDSCWGVTESIYVDPAGYADGTVRERLLLEGLGLLGG